MHISYRFPQMNLIQWHIQHSYSDPLRIIVSNYSKMCVSYFNCKIWKCPTSTHQSTHGTYDNHLVLLSGFGIRGSWSFEKRQQFLLYQVGAAKTSNKSNVKWMPENQSHSNHNDWLESYIFRKTSYTSLFVQTISFPNHQQFFDKVKIWLINRFRNRNTSLGCWSGIGIMWCLNQKHNQNQDLWKALELNLESNYDTANPLVWTGIGVNTTRIRLAIINFGKPWNLYHHLWNQNWIVGIWITALWIVKQYLSTRVLFDLSISSDVFSFGSDLTTDVDVSVVLFNTDSEWWLISPPFSTTSSVGCTGVVCLWLLRGIAVSAFLVLVGVCLFDLLPAATQQMQFKPGQNTCTSRFM